MNWFFLKIIAKKINITFHSQECVTVEYMRIPNPKICSFILFTGIYDSKKYRDGYFLILKCEWIQQKRFYKVKKIG